MIVGKYKAIYMPSHPRRLDNDCVYEHIIVAEQKLGRSLKDGEIVHHKDTDKMNNSPDNLMVFKTKKDHTRFHRSGCNEKYLILTEDGSYICSDEINKCICPICNGAKAHDAEVCRKCYEPKRKVANRPSKEELKRMIKNMAFTQIGKRYGVKDNTIRKWCDDYGLPRKRKDIEVYSEDEWNAI